MYALIELHDQVEARLCALQPNKLSLKLQIRTVESPGAAWD